MQTVLISPTCIPRRIKRIGRIRADGQFDIVWQTRAPLRPAPFPEFRSPESWLSFLDSFYTAWGWALVCAAVAVALANVVDDRIDAARHIDMTLRSALRDLDIPT